MMDDDDAALAIAHKGLDTMKTLTIQEKIELSANVSNAEWIKHRGKDYAAINLDDNTIVATGDDAEELEEMVGEKHANILVVPNEYRDAALQR